MNATRAAVEEVSFPGGSALIKAVPRLQALAATEKSNDRRLGIKIVAEAIQSPIKTIVDNASGNTELLLPVKSLNDRFLQFRFTMPPVPLTST